MQLWYLVNHINHIIKYTTNAKGNRNLFYLITYFIKLNPKLNNIFLVQII